MKFLRVGREAREMKFTRIRAELVGSSETVDARGCRATERTCRASCV